MASIEEIRRISILASAQGVDAAKVSLDQLAASQTKVATTAAGMATSTDNASKSLLSAASKVESLRRANDAAYASQQRLEAGQRTVLAAVNQGAISSQTAAATLAALQKRYGGVAEAADVAAKSHMAHGAAVGNSRIAMMEFEHVARSMVDSIAAGASPMRVLAFEGSRIVEAFQQGGGASGVLSTFGGLLSKLANPTVLLTGALAGLGVAGFSAFNSWQDRLNALQLSLNGLGRATGATLGGLNNLAISAAGGRTSSSQAAAAVSAFAATGTIVPGTMGQLIAPQAGQREGLVQQFSQATGAGFSESLKTLAADIADPTKGAKQLNEQFGLLGDNEIQLITHLDAGGERLAAQSRLIGDLRDRIQGAADVTSIWSRAWDTVAAAASKATEAAGRFITPSLQDQRRAVAEQLATDQGAWAPFRSEGAISAETEKLAALDRTIQGVALGAASAGADQIAKAKSRDIGDITRQTIPEINARQGLLDQRNRLQEAMGTPGALDLADAAAAQESITRLDARLASFASAAEKVTQDATAAAQAVMAQTATQRTAIEATKTWADVVRDTGNFALAAATATAKWNEALAESKHALDDETRSVTENFNLAMQDNPLARQKLQIGYEGEAWRRAHAEGATAAPGYTLGGETGTGASALLSSLSPDQQAAMLAKFTQLEGSPGNRPDYNNPGNIMFGPWAAAHGATGGGMGGVTNAGGFTTPDSGIAKFPTQEAGQAALRSLVFGQYGQGTISDLARGWLGGGSGGNTATFAAGLASAAGVGASPAFPGTQSISAGHALNVSTSLSNADLVLRHDIMNSEQKTIDAANLSLQTQIDIWGKLPGTVAAATERTKLYNDEVKQGGVDFANTMAAMNEGLAKQAGALATVQQNLKDLDDTMNAVRGGFESAASTIGSDLLAGKPRHTMWKDVGNSVSRSLMSSAVGQVTDLAFGRAGQAGGGLLGGPLGALLGPMFGVKSGTGTQSVQTFNAGTLVVGTMSGVGTALAGAAGTAGGGGGLLGWLGGLFGGSAAGGAAAAGIGMAADGGPISGPGGPRSDSILIAASNGEYIVNARAAAMHRPLLDSINRYADGGPVSRHVPTIWRGDGGDTHYKAGDVHIVIQAGGETSDAQNRKTASMIKLAVAQGQAQSAKGFQKAQLGVSVQQRLLVG